MTADAAPPRQISDAMPRHADRLDWMTCVTERRDQPKNPRCETGRPANADLPAGRKPNNGTVRADIPDREVKNKAVDGGTPVKRYPIRGATPRVSLETVSAAVRRALCRVAGQGLNKAKTRRSGFVMEACRCG